MSVSDKVNKEWSMIEGTICMPETIEDVSIDNEYQYENDLKPYSYSKSFS